ncbi:D-hexose-6-phosphate mutarotase [Variovorax sp. GT1P44]|uniref:D-hexose-6-phosphate mutarotase n=1 Tax=Variovorax sp. GT1P44 TaxID=3443742 RepID=UPI003F459F9B
MSLQALDFRGQPAVRTSLPGGDSCTVALHGGHVLSWITADGVERLYLSPDARFDGHSAIRGGVPICWPQFNMRGPLPKHGFVRNVAWQAESDEGDTKRRALVLSLHSDEATRAIWPHSFRARLSVTLAPHQLRIALTIDNTSSGPWSFAAALHSYLRVDEVTAARLEGLQGANRWDAVRDDRHVELAAALGFGEEFDSVYAAPARPLRLVQPSGTLEISQSASCTETVVWNPGPLLSAKLEDLPDDGWRHMLCVEAARIDESVLLAPGGQWQGWQQLRVL